jgi:hypothetical protein
MESTGSKHIPTGEFTPAGDLPAAFAEAVRPLAGPAKPEELPERFLYWA